MNCVFEIKQEMWNVLFKMGDCGMKAQCGISNTIAGLLTSGHMHVARILAVRFNWYNLELSIHV